MSSNKQSNLTEQQLLRCALRKVQGSNEYVALRLKPVLTSEQKIDAKWHGIQQSQWGKSIFQENEDNPDEFEILIDGKYLIDELLKLGLTDGNRVFGETPTGAINGVNAVFTSLNAFIPEDLEVYLNGVRQKLVDDYNSSGNNTITMVASPTNGERILINYSKL